MNRFLQICGLAASLQFVVVQALEAATLYIEPSPQSVVLDSLVSVDVKVGDLAGTQVGAYDFILSYDSSLLDFTSLGFDSYLGYSADSLVSVVNVPNAGTLNVAEVSFLSVSELFSLQTTDPFTLFSVTFKTKSSGKASLSLLGNISGYEEPDNFLSDANGDPISLTSADGALIKIEPKQDGSIPEPSSLLLMGLGLPLLRRRLGQK